MKTSITHILFQILFPEYCISCGTRGELLCKNCTPNLRPNLIYIDKDTSAFFEYRQKPVKKALWLLKYKGKKKIADIFASLMHDQIEELLQEKELMENFVNPIFVAVPISRSRKRVRGFNQAELLAEKLSSMMSTKPEYIKEVLLKNINTKRQATFKDKNHRMLNLIDTMDIAKPSLVKDRNIVLIDDVTTTGATFEEAKKVLKRAGVKKVICIAFAH